MLFVCLLLAPLSYCSLLSQVYLADDPLETGNTNRAVKGKEPLIISPNCRSPHPQVNKQNRELLSVFSSMLDLQQGLTECKEGSPEQKRLQALLDRCKRKATALQKSIRDAGGTPEKRRWWSWKCAENTLSICHANISSCGVDNAATMLWDCR
jgi:hypothetical protein